MSCFVSVCARVLKSATTKSTELALDTSVCVSPICQRRRRRSRKMMKKKLRLRLTTHNASSSASQKTIIDHIHVGSFYELDHSQLPPSAAAHINSIRVVMVDEKSVTKVSVRFPSLDSLQTHLNEDSTDRNPLPVFDNGYNMSPKTASEALYRRVPHREVREQSRVWSFWNKEQRGFTVCWGKRKSMRCVAMHDSVEEEQPEIHEDVKVGVVKRRKQNDDQIVVRDATPKEEAIEGSIERWTARRYKAGEENIFKVMKEKCVNAENPILRPALRAEARKVIGDTGLIDHLLKHMDGKVAPDGADRFRRRHNGAGALEFWLESADLMRIREEAGAKDPYWTPRPGWKMGDNPSLDPIYVRMFKEVWEAIDNLRREMGFQQQQQQQDVVMTPSNSSLTTLDQGKGYSSLTNPKVCQERYRELVVQKARIDEQMLQLSQFFPGLDSLEEHVPKPTMEESREKSHAEEKAAKIKRLQSTFKICKPIATYLRPDMCISPLDMFQQTDSFKVPTPPSVSSANRSASRLFLHWPTEENPGSPLKLSAETREGNTSTFNNVMIKLPDKTNSLLRIDDSIRTGKALDIEINDFPDAYSTDSSATPRTPAYQ